MEKKSETKPEPIVAEDAPATKDQPTDLPSLKAFRISQKLTLVKISRRWSTYNIISTLKLKK